MDGAIGFVLIEVKEDLGDESPVEVIVFLELNFNEVDGIVGMVFVGDEYAIESKGEFFDFDGLKLVVLGKVGGFSDKLKEEFGEDLEEGIEDFIGFH